MPTLTNHETNSPSYLVLEGIRSGNLRRDDNLSLSLLTVSLRMSPSSPVAYSLIGLERLHHVPVLFLQSSINKKG